MRHFLCLISLVLCAGAVHAAPPKPIGQSEAQAFGERVTRQLQRHDARALSAYRSDSEFLLLLTESEQAVGLYLKGAELVRFLKRNLSQRAPVQTGTSCRYDVREDGRAVESCISVNVLQPQRPTFSISMIARKGKALYYQSTLVTDSARLAGQFGVYGTPDDEDDDEEDDILEA